jgi:hypothetical protein
MTRSFSAVSAAILPSVSGERLIRAGEQPRKEETGMPGEQTTALAVRGGYRPNAGRKPQFSAYVADALIGVLAVAQALVERVFELAEVAQAATDTGRAYGEHEASAAEIRLAALDALEAEIATRRAKQAEIVKMLQAA